ncbi:5-methyltetrahydropteroyltriglutamate--homocysteine methyltransferase [Halomicrobium salinisoli]|uniref:5-methyltetrahydropteroyltriglutamate-- homocysteine methyltransferase n=1 Tax=Halomicrobium salinisoli TaxID=2878391 RepID=UPI001CF03BEC|nr:5-methyltetrahydropteroyltriglutamate--homocysteine methyltransferase [Halomicrobium salinisoli]
MPEVLSATPGLYPLPDWAKDELAGLKGRQKGGLISGDEGEAIVAAYEQAREEVVDLQTDAGLDLAVEGQLRWDDMLAHPLAVADAVETRGIVRYYDNNNFYREPVVTDDLAASGDVGAELDAASGHVDDGLAAVLPGPYTLADLAADEHYGDSESFLAAVADFLAAEAEQFSDVETLFLLEPSLLESPPGDGADERASEAIDAVASATDADVVAHTYWESHGGDGSLDEKVYAHLLDADIDAVGFDLVADHEGSTYLINEYGCTDDVALGVVDGQNTLVEDTEEVAERVEWTLSNTPGADFETVYATINTPTFYLPSSKFEEKLETLGALELTEVTA